MYRRIDGKTSLRRQRNSSIFYGQQYGFTLIETLTIGLFYYLFGISEISVKISMIFLWSLGWILVVLSVSQLWGCRVGVWCALFLLFTPSWYVWSTKARGGYISAFVLCHLIIWFLSLYHNSGQELKKSLAYAIGLGVGLVFLCQPIWILVLLPFVLGFQYGNSQKVRILAIAVPFIAVLFLRSLLYDSYHRPDLFGNFDPLAGIQKLPDRIYTLSSGSFLFVPYIPLGDFTKFSAWCWTILLVFTGFIGIVLAVRKSSREIYVCTISLLSPFLLSILINEEIFGPRYLLSSVSFFCMIISFLFSCALTWIRTRREKMLYLLFCIPFLLSVLSWGEFKNLTYDGRVRNPEIKEFQSLQCLLSVLEDNKIYHVYCSDPLFQWNIIFYSKERILARWRHPYDRYPIYPFDVDQALWQNLPVALVGKLSDLYILERLVTQDPSLLQRVWKIEDRYFVFFYPRSSELESLYFYLNPKK